MWLSIVVVLPKKFFECKKARSSLQLPLFFLGAQKGNSFLLICYFHNLRADPLHNIRTLVKILIGKKRKDIDWVIPEDEEK